MLEQILGVKLQNNMIKIISFPRIVVDTIADKKRFLTIAELN